VKSKHTYKTKAKDLYNSTLFRAQRAFAEHFADQWFVLSAKYGLLDPETEIEPYEETLKGASSHRKRIWSAQVFAELTKIIKPDNKIVITAGEDYCRYLVPMIAALGNAVERPVKGLRMGFIPGHLYGLIATAKKPAIVSATLLKQVPHPTLLKQVPHSPPAKITRQSLSSTGLSQWISDFYGFIDRLRQKAGGPYVLKDINSSSAPKRGVYFFFEDGEFRADGVSPRVVRVGTHGLHNGSKSTLYGRLVNHRGTRSGSGNHRGSVFRLHIGKALIKRNAIDCPTWARNSSVPNEITLLEKSLEQQVSDYIGRMKVLLLNIPDEPGPQSLRGFVERNSIGLLSGNEPASKHWLGLDTVNPAIINSHLWNVNHTDYKPDINFLECLSGLISQQ
jgi:hypothetical protein